MQKKIGAVLFSTRLTGILFLVFAAAMAIGTFLDASEANPPSNYTRVLIYNAWWFELIMGLFVVNFAGNIVRYRLHRKEKWTTLLLHLAFLFILIGAGITRYIGYEGSLAIREGATENSMVSEKTYFKAYIDGDYVIDGRPQRRIVKEQVMLSERLDNHRVVNTDYNGQPVQFTFLDYMENARQSIVPDENGTEYLKIVEAEAGSRHTHWLRNGEVKSLHGVLFALNNPTQGAINLSTDEEGNYRIQTPFAGSYLNMNQLMAQGIDPNQLSAVGNLDEIIEEYQQVVPADSTQTLHLRSRYQLAGIAFVIPEPIITGRDGVVRATEDEPSTMSALTVAVKTREASDTLHLFGGKGFVPRPETVRLDNLEIHLSYGSEELELPFAVELNAFIAEKYPGTEKVYKSYKSKVTVHDLDGHSFDYDIFMNNILDHKGYRLFQASFDPDEQGTILSVNHDFWGTWVTYFGYILLFAGLLLILFDKNSRFGALRKKLRKVKKKKARLTTVVFALMLTSGWAQSGIPDTHARVPAERIDSIIRVSAVSKEHAARFSELIIQDEGGRMKPVHTFASELLRKVSRSNTYQGLDANQVLISMSEFPRLWAEAPIISLKRGNDSIRKVLRVPQSNKHVTLLDLFDEQGEYKLAPYLEKASTKSNPNQFDKDFIKVHEGFYLLNQALTGSVLRVYPIPDDPNNTWISHLELGDTPMEGRDTVLRRLLPEYFNEIRKARHTGDYTEAEKRLDGIHNFQKIYGGDIMPNSTKVQAEIIYNKADVFNRLYRYFLLVGALMFVFIIIQIFRGENRTLPRLVRACHTIIWVFFALMTLGLATRWYISGHAPWSDAYESVIYVAWATVLFGLLFGRKSTLTVASTAFVASIVLWVAHQNWMDPAIANLQPVLDSYWLMIHVSVIVGSYGPFTLGMILGLTALILMLLSNRNNRAKMELTLKELTYINEMALTVGVVLLIIGNFLGGMWANESWGRYWGWDPKETWALISIMIYAFVIHMRLIPGLRSLWWYNVCSVLAYASIMMTYFGVNFYLTGLHSYASGDKPMTPGFVFISLAVVILLSAVSYWRYQQVFKRAKV